ncbi:hypothetical protein PQX77_000879 [Marasmius sp. AFHP31]|nr:hypothetical protein PQX77_000879 [Marasmius sp. AFHP31]
MVTYGSNDGLSFNVTSVNAFILWGSPDRNHPVKRITISPKPGSSRLTSTKETFMFDVARYLDYQQILYWESGLDRETSYTVEIFPVIGRQLFAFNELQLLDGAKEKRTAKVTPYVGFIEHDTAPPSQPSSTPPPSRETDAGSLPSQYQPSCTGATIRDGNAPTSPAVETSGTAKDAGTKWIKSGKMGGSDEDTFRVSRTDK